MLRLIGAAAIALASLGAAHAGTITVSGFAHGYSGSTVAVAPEATLTSYGAQLYFGGAYSDPNSFCAIDFGGTCEASLNISFNDVIKNLKFDVGGWDPGDFVDLSVYGVGDALLGSVGLSSDVTGLDLSGFGSITRLFFADSSTGAGLGYANFSFDKVASVPVPAGLPLLAGALAAAFAVSRRKKTQA